MGSPCRRTPYPVPCLSTGTVSYATGRAWDREAMSPATWDRSKPIPQLRLHSLPSTAGDASRLCSPQASVALRRARRRQRRGPKQSRSPPHTPRMFQSPNLSPRLWTSAASAFMPCGNRVGSGTGRPFSSSSCTFPGCWIDQPPSSTSVSYPELFGRDETSEDGVRVLFVVWTGRCAGVRRAAIKHRGVGCSDCVDPPGGFARAWGVDGGDERKWRTRR